MLPLRPHLYWGGTSCPGAQWPEWVPQLRAAVLQEDDMLFAIQREGSGAVYATDGIHKWGIPRMTMWKELQDKGLMRSGLIQLSATTFDRIRPTHTGASSSGGGLSEAQIRKIVRQEIDKTKTKFSA